jgi:hypothetical protein
MKFTIEDDYEATLFGFKINSVQHGIIIISYVIFLMTLWPLVSSTLFFIPLMICIIGVAPGDFVYNEIIESGTLFKVLAYLGLFITTSIYVYFFSEDHIVVKLIHYVVYFTFAYIYTKKGEAIKKEYTI